MHAHLVGLQPQCPQLPSSHCCNTKGEKAPPVPRSACFPCSSQLSPRPANPYLCRKPLRRSSQPSHAQTRRQRCFCQPSSVQQQEAFREDEEPNSDEANTSQRSWRDNIDPNMEAAMLAAPFAAISLESIGNIQQGFQNFKDRIYYGETLPPVGSLSLSYARFLELLAERRIKRIIIMSDGKIAMVEVPVEGWASDFQKARNDRQDPEIEYAPERPEWQIEKHRFYVELPGDLWEEGEMMRLMKSNMAYIGEDGRMPYENLLRVGQVRPELVVVDPSDSYVWLNEYSTQFLPILGLLGLRLVVGVGDWLIKKFGKKKKDRMQEMADEYGRHRATEYNVGDVGSRKDTGVRYADVAGIDRVKGDIEETMHMILGAPEFIAIGAKPPRGILLEGPPGTGKTYLAKAMAGEAGIPFYSANGAEFVEMFQGVAAARIRDLFKVARTNAPSIIFIDEIDAIGKARSTGSSDSGTQEREQGLLQMLCEMDGFKKNSKVLVIGATNRIDSLDDALIRPGRFDRTIYMGRPTTNNRLKILQVHAANKPIDRGNDDAVLQRVAELAVGYSGAELANLLNEAAILAVREEAPEISFNIILSAMDKIKLGLAQRPLDDSPAKRRMSTVEVGRAVAIALTPGMPPIENLSTKPRGGVMGRILFRPQEFGRSGGQWHSLAYSQKTNAAVQSEPQGDFELCCGLLIPLYAARATEEVFYGKQGVTLGTAQEISLAGDMATWLVQHSQLHPAFRDLPVMYGMDMGGEVDPTTERTSRRFEGLILQLQKAAYEQAKHLIRQRKVAIEQLAAELIGDPQETVQGSRIVEVLEATPVAQPDMEPSNGVWSEHLNPEKEQVSPSSASIASFSGQTAGKPGFTHMRPAPEQQADPMGDLLVASTDVRQAAEVVLGRLDISQLVGGPQVQQTAAQVQDALQNEEILERLKAMRRYAKDNSDDVPFPPSPIPNLSELPPVYGYPLETWVEPADDIVIQ